MKLNRRTKLGVTAVVSAVAIGAGTTAFALAGEESETSATGPEADKAVAAALALLPGGRVNAVERDSENGATWEVEVTKADGTTVDVRLGADYDLVVIEGDTEDAEGDNDEDGESD